MDEILILDIQEEFIQGLSTFLEQRGFLVFKASNQEEALRILEIRKIYVMLLEVRLLNYADSTDMSGIDFARRYHQNVPKIFLSSFPDFKIVREALSLNSNRTPIAVDFILKEEGYEAIITSINSVKNIFARKVNMLSKEHISGIILDRDNFLIRNASQQVKLTPQEYTIIEYFVNNPQKVISRYELLHNVFGEASVSGYVDEKRINNLVYRLRKKIRKELGLSDIIETSRGYGYKLKTDT